MKIEQAKDAHRWLEQLVGEWTFESETPNPGECKGTESFRKVGELWVVGESRMEVPDGEPVITVITIGFDPVRNRYCGTFIGSMMTKLWIYDGELDQSGRTLYLYTEGPAFDENGDFSATETAQYRDQITFLEEGHRTFSGSVKDKNGQWKPFMLNHCHRMNTASKAEKAS